MNERDTPRDPNLAGKGEVSELYLQNEELSTPEWYPALTNLSAGFAYSRTLQAQDPDLPEYVTVIQHGMRDQLAMAQWNMLWEAAQFRGRMFDHDDLPYWLAQIAEQGDRNVIFVPRTHTRYYEFAPLYHLLPKTTLEKYGLPVLARGLWPDLMGRPGIERLLPADTPQRLAKAWAGAIWSHLMPSSRMLGFTKNDPVHLLSHNLDFWIPPVTQVIQERLKDLPQGPLGKTAVDQPAVLEDGSILEGVRITRPRIGAEIWTGEEDAAQARAEVVEAADRTGNLRAILDAVKSHRIEDDFSDYWTYAREDFERKLHHKRAKAKVTFVEVPKESPVQGPETDVIGNMVCNDFLALLDPKDRHIVILLSSGYTQLTQIAEIMGYANHSPVSKRLARIREMAEKILLE